MKKHIALCLPCYSGQVHLHWMACYVRTAEMLTSLGIKLDFCCVSGCGIIEAARNELVTLALETEATHVLFVDAQQLWMPEGLQRLLRDLDKHPAVSAPVANREGKFAARYTGEEDGFLKRAEHSAIAFMGMRRDVLEAMREGYQDLAYKNARSEQIDIGLFNSYIENGTYIGEDLAFTKRLVKLGIPLWVDEAIKVMRIK